MKYLKSVITIFAFVVLVACNNQGVTKKELKTEVDSVSYAIGLNMANQMKVNFDEIDQDLFVQGFKNRMDSMNILIEDDKIMGILNTYFGKKQAEKQKKAQEEAMKRREEQAKKLEADFAEVKKEGEDFLVANKTKTGVKTTESGLQYKVLKQGTGVKPTSTDRVKVHYHGTLIDGTVFDSSVERGMPFETFVNRGVIKGWLETFTLMEVGSKYRIFVPQELAYGAFPHQGGKVRPFDTLIFDIELLEIVK